MDLQRYFPKEVIVSKQNFLAVRIQMRNALLLGGVMLSGAACSKRTRVDLGLREPKLETYASCEEIRVEAARNQMTYDALASARNTHSQAESMTLGAAPSASSAPLTERQSDGVDELDTIGSTQDQIFYSRGDAIEVFRRSDFNLVGVVELPKVSRAAFFVSEALLYVLGAEMQRDSTDTNQGNSSDSNVVVYTPRMTLMIFRLKAGQLPKKVEQRYIEGTLVGARAVEGRILIVANRYVGSPAGSASGLAHQIQGESVGSIPCNRIYKPLIGDLDRSLVQVSTFKLEGDELVENHRLLSGGGDIVFVSKANLYVLKSGVYSSCIDGCSWDSSDPQQTELYERLQQSSFVTKIHWDSKTGDLDVRALGLVSGFVKDSYSMNEIDDSGDQLLALATSTPR